MKLNNILTITAFITLFMYSCNSTKRNFKEKDTEINETHTKEIESKNRKKIIYKNQTLNPNINYIIVYMSCINHIKITYTLYKSYMSSI